VSTQATGEPTFDTAVVPVGPQGMPTAGRVSRPAGGDVGDDVCDLVVGCTVVVGGEDALDGGVAVDGGVVVTGALAAGNEGLVAAGVLAGAGATGSGGGVAVTGASRAGDVSVTDVPVSTFVGVSWDSEAERRYITPMNPPTATATTVSPSAAVCSIRRRRDVIDASSGAACEATDCRAVKVSTGFAARASTGFAVGVSTGLAVRVSTGLPVGASAGRERGQSRLGRRRIVGLRLADNGGDLTVWWAGRLAEARFESSGEVGATPVPVLG
jgi:hypothetical protein